jgi:hypothetical protein
MDEFEEMGQFGQVGQWRNPPWVEKSILRLRFKKM